MKKENEILSSWNSNASEWSRIIEQKGIASRKFTNPAIADAITAYAPLKILDLGCGEGWLTRELSGRNNKVTGADATEALLDNARMKGDQNFYRVTYEEIIAGKQIPEAPFNAIVLNFCLYQKNEVPELLSALHTSLTGEGLVFIQTLHPGFLQSNNLPYEDQWIEDSWKGLDGNFVQPHSWYARTLESWINMFQTCNYELLRIKEVKNDKEVPVSIIFILKEQGT